MQKTARIFNALKLRLEANKQEALGRIELLIINPVAIADHTNFSNDIEELVRTISDADGMLLTISQLFPSAPTPILPDPDNNDLDQSDD